MGRKPVLGLAGLFLAGVTMTGCECTEWCCSGNSKTVTTPSSRPAPDSRTMNPMQPTTSTQSSSSGANRFGTQGTTQTTIQPVSAGESSVTAPRDSFQGSPATTPSAAGAPSAPSAPDMSVPATPSVERRPVSVAPVEDTNEIPPPAIPRSTSSGVRIQPPTDPVNTPPSQPLPPLEKTAAPATPAIPETSAVDTVPPAPTPVNEGKTQSSSKYQSNGPSLDVPPPPPPHGVPPMPGSGPSGN
jgi:hypothetical protein